MVQTNKTRCNRKPPMQDISVIQMSLTERTLIVIQLCLRSQIGSWGKYYYSLFYITHYFHFNVGFTNIVVLCTGRSSVDVKYEVPNVLNNVDHPKKMAFIPQANIGNMMMY